MKLRVEGDLRVPGDKSITHRALMLAASAAGESRLRGLLPGGDCRSTASVLRALGCSIPDLPADGAGITIRGGGLATWRVPSATLDCGNSGTTARLIMGLLAGRPFCARLTGDDSLRSRPMRRVTEPLAAMGAAIREIDLPDRLPLEICGGDLRGIDHVSPRASAQIKSAILLAGISGGVGVSVREPARSRDHTERLLSALGASVRSRPASAGDGSWEVVLDPYPDPLPPLDLDVPGDPSSAAFLLAAALLAGAGELRVRGVGTNPTRIGFLQAVRAMGGAIAVENEREVAGEPVGDLVARPARLSGTEIGADQVPAMIDEIPLLAALAARAEGETVVRGAGELRAKESDRIAVMVANLRAVGVDARELPDGLVVRGSDVPLRGRVAVHHDHRIAMAFAVLGLLRGNDITLDQPEVVEISYPGFWDVLDSITSASTPR
jgi:3-phosphoshikimate 1-carboxyvinyltransferase